MRAIMLRMASPTELAVICVEQDSEGKGVEKGRMSVEITDGTAILCISRMWLAGITPEQIAAAMQLGLLPPKVK